MATVADYLGQRPGNVRVEYCDELPGIANLGFEVELEGGDGDWPEVDGWDGTHDGSLRDGREYIFAGPQSGPTALASIEAFGNVMADYAPDPTFRCSTHIHMDVRDLEFTVLEKVVLAYMIFEDAFFDQCQAYRKNSNFCIPFMKNDWLSSAFGTRVLMHEDERLKWAGYSAWSKYSALNLQTVTQHGTVEFRGSHALTTRGELLALARRMLSIKKMAVDMAAVPNEEFIQRLSQEGFQLFLPGAFPEGYLPDQGGIAMGLSAALNSLSAMHERERQAAAERERHLQRQAQEAERAERRRVDNNIRRMMDTPLGVTAEVWLQYNINGPQHHTLQGVIQAVAALRGLGIEATLTNVVPQIDPEVVAYLRQHVGRAVNWTGLPTDILLDVLV